MADPIIPNPTNIISQVPGSGTALVTGGVGVTTAVSPPGADPPPPGAPPGAPPPPIPPTPKIAGPTDARFGAAKGAAGATTSAKVGGATGGTI
jgi:hypothetical protein